MIRCAYFERASSSADDTWVNDWLVGGWVGGLVNFSQITSSQGLAINKLTQKIM